MSGIQFSGLLLFMFFCALYLLGIFWELKGIRQQLKGEGK